MWTNAKPTYGCQIRVSRGLYYHHGIYLDDNNVIHFASLLPGRETDPNSASVVKTPLNVFLKDGILEVREYTEEEKKVIRTPQDVVNYALGNLGLKGYNLISFNCEHFSNECVFGERFSEQVDNVTQLFSFFRNPI